MKKETFVLPASIACILILLIISAYSKPQQMNIAEINKELDEKDVRISGYVTYFTPREKVTLMGIKDSTGSITAAVFDKIILHKSDLVEVSGRVSVYNNKTEILADKIVKISG